ncbi:MAG: AI-2E family transporter [Gorillibacterium sp.]|nr:AI-2E family transporter [Gorillibacterium sp.]
MGGINVRNMKFFQIILGIIGILLIIYLGDKVKFVFSPIISFVNMLIVPLMISVFFYYLLRPLVDYMQKRNMKRTLAILLIYLFFTLIIVAFSLSVWPRLREQLLLFINSAPNFVENLRTQLEELQSDGVLAKLLTDNENAPSTFSEYFEKAFNAVYTYVSGLSGLISNFVIIIGTVPILLFYMLKEGRKLGRNILKLIPRQYKRDGREVMTEIDSALSSFIVSRVIINLALGVMMYIGFLIIGLPYSLLLTVVSFFFNFIPYFGALLAAIPVLIVAFIESPTMALWSLLIILVAQQIQDNVLSPMIYGKRLEIHPMTIIILLLIGGDLYGILGMLLALPIYMVLKIIVTRIYRLFFAEKFEDIVG